jgi:hypothetical protein
MLAAAGMAAQVIIIGGMAGSVRKKYSVDVRLITQRSV